MVNLRVLVFVFEGGFLGFVGVKVWEDFVVSILVSFWRGFEG